MSDGDCDELLEKIDRIARLFNGYEYGLPMHDRETVERMREAIREVCGGKAA